MKVFRKRLQANSFLSISDTKPRATQGTRMLRRAASYLSLYLQPPAKPLGFEKDFSSDRPTTFLKGGNRKQSDTWMATRLTIQRLPDHILHHFHSSATFQSLCSMYTSKHGCTSMSQRALTPFAGVDGRSSFRKEKENK